MNAHFKITVYRDDGRTDHLEAPSISKARDMAQAEIIKDPKCSTNIVVSEFEPDSPNKYSVWMERYAMVNGNIRKIQY